MLSWVRGLQKNWIVRGFFVLLIVIFVFWGISFILPDFSGGPDSVATVNGKPVDISLVQTAYQTALTQAQQSNPNPDLADRRRIAETAMENVLREQILGQEARKLGVVAPDSAVRQIVYGIPAFQSNGAFSQAVFNQVLQANNRTPDQFLADIKQNLLDRQLLVPVIAGIGPPQELVDQIFSYIAEQRFAETVNIPLSAQPVPKPPARTVLERYWRNHPALFTAPEYRTVQVVILAPSLVAVNEFVSDDDVAAAYQRATQGRTAVPLRSVQIITAPDAKKAASLAAAWRNATGWPDMQALAKRDGGNPVELDDAQQSAIPSAALGSAVFAALPDEVVGPVQGDFGYYVFKVIGTSTSIPLEASIADQIRQSLKLQKAQADVAQDVSALQDALAGLTPLDKLPGNIGLVAVEGTMDAGGDTPDGTPAPIPGGADVKAAIVKAAFAAKPNQPPALQSGPDGSYFALTVNNVTPPALQPFDQVKGKVLAAWTADAVSREAEVKAADLLAAVNGGDDLDDAAATANLATTMSAPVTRNAPPAGMASQMVPLLFSMKPGAATMLQTSDGFEVAVLAKVVNPTPQQDSTDYSQVYAAMAKALQNDIAESVIAGMQGRDKVSVDQKLLAQIYQ
jgi:peptidyl-prolyl cis-trans isomerase D